MVAGMETFRSVPNHDSHLVGFRVCFLSTSGNTDAPLQTWWQNKGLRELNLLLLCVFVAQFLNGFDSALLSSFQSMASWKACKWSRPTLIIIVVLTLLPSSR